MLIVQKLSMSAVCVGVLLGLGSATLSAQAAEPVKPSITITKPWARASAGMARAGAAFMTIENMSAIPDRLIAAEANVSKVVELHTHRKDNGIMRMRQVEAIAVPAQTQVHLQPGGLHIMFIGLHNPLKEGEEFPLHLQFEKSGVQTITVQVKGVGAR